MQRYWRRSKQRWNSSNERLSLFGSIKTLCLFKGMKEVICVKFLSHPNKILSYFWILVSYEKCQSISVHSPEIPHPRNICSESLSPEWQPQSKCWDADQICRWRRKNKFEAFSKLEDSRQSCNTWPNPRRDNQQRLRPCSCLALQQNASVLRSKFLQQNKINEISWRETKQ